MAARVEPLHASAGHQTLRHDVAKFQWSNSTVMARVRDWVVPSLGLDSGCYWIIDDRGFVKKGKHSVAVARSLAVNWASDTVGLERARMPKDIVFATKPEIALTQIRQAFGQGVVLAGVW